MGVLCHSKALLPHVLLVTGGMERGQLGLIQLPAPNGHIFYVQTLLAFAVTSEVTPEDPPTQTDIVPSGSWGLCHTMTASP